VTAEGPVDLEHQRLVETLWRDERARSRNKNFYRFRDSAPYARAVRAVRSLRSLREDIVKFRGVSRLLVESAPDERVRLTLFVPGLHLRRSMCLRRFEVELLWAEAGLGPRAVPLTQGPVPEICLDKTT
jgi:hypothetical protein